MYSPYYFIRDLVTFRDLSIFLEVMSIYILLSISAAYIERISFLNSWREDLQLTPFPLYTWCSSMAQICACFQWKKICDDSEGKRSIKLYFHIFIYLNKKQKKIQITICKNESFDNFVIFGFGQKVKNNNKAWVYLHWWINLILSLSTAVPPARRVRPSQVRPL